jgi:hypothetical protein
MQSILGGHVGCLVEINTALVMQYGLFDVPSVTLQDACIVVRLGEMGGECHGDAQVLCSLLDVAKQSENDSNIGVGFMVVRVNGKGCFVRCDRGIKVAHELVDDTDTMVGLHHARIKMDSELVASEGAVVLSRFAVGDAETVMGVSKRGLEGDCALVGAHGVFYGDAGLVCGGEFAESDCEVALCEVVVWVDGECSLIGLDGQGDVSGFLAQDADICPRLSVKRVEMDAAEVAVCRALRVARVCGADADVVPCLGIVRGDGDGLLVVFKSCGGEGRAGESDANVCEEGCEYCFCTVSVLV